MKVQLFASVLLCAIPGVLSTEEPNLRGGVALATDFEDQVADLMTKDKDIKKEVKKVVDKKKDFSKKDIKKAVDKAIKKYENKRNKKDSTLCEDRSKSQCYGFCEWDRKDGECYPKKYFEDEDFSFDSSEDLFDSEDYDMDLYEDEDSEDYDFNELSDSSSDLMTKDKDIKKEVKKVVDKKKDFSKKDIKKAVDKAIKKYENKRNKKDSTLCEDRSKSQCYGFCEWDRKDGECYPKKYFEDEDFSFDSSEDLFDTEDYDMDLYEDEDSEDYDFNELSDSSSDLMTKDKGGSTKVKSSRNKKDFSKKDFKKAVNRAIKKHDRKIERKTRRGSCYDRKKSHCHGHCMWSHGVCYPKKYFEDEDFSFDSSEDLFDSEDYDMDLYEDEDSEDYDWEM